MMPNPSVLISLRSATASDRDLGERLVGWVRRLGFDPAVASDGRQVVDRVRRRPFAATLVEYGVVGEGGVDAWRVIHPLLGRRLVLMTREMRRDLWFEALREGVGAVLPLPPREAMVRAALCAATGHPVPGTGARSAPPL